MTLLYSPVLTVHVYKILNLWIFACYILQKKYQKTNLGEWYNPIVHCHYESLSHGQPEKIGLKIKILKMKHKNITRWQKKWNFEIFLANFQTKNFK